MTRAALLASESLFAHCPCIFKSDYVEHKMYFEDEIGLFIYMFLLFCEHELFYFYFTCQGSVKQKAVLMTCSLLIFNVWLQKHTWMHKVDENDPYCMVFFKRKKVPWCSVQVNHLRIWLHTNVSTMIRNELQYNILCMLCVCMLFCALTQIWHVRWTLVPSESQPPTGSRWSRSWWERRRPHTDSVPGPRVTGPRPPPPPLQPDSTL